MKWGLYAPDVLPLWVAEMDAEPCRPVVDAVTAALSRETPAERLRATLSLRSLTRFGTMR